MGHGNAKLGDEQNLETEKQAITKLEKYYDVEAMCSLLNITPQKVACSSKGLSVGIGKKRFFSDQRIGGSEVEAILGALARGRLPQEEVLKKYQKLLSIEGVPGSFTECIFIRNARRYFMKSKS